MLTEASQVIGRATNNVAEYRALLLGIETALELGANELDLVGDSELIVKQVRGEYKVKNADLKPLHAEVRAALSAVSLVVDPPRPPRAQRRGGPPRQRSARRPEPAPASAPLPPPAASTRRLPILPSLRL